MVSLGTHGLCKVYIGDDTSDENCLFYLLSRRCKQLYHRIINNFWNGKRETENGALSAFPVSVVREFSASAERPLICLLTAA